MPIMGGRELIDRLRSDPATASIPILVLSANGDIRIGQADAAFGKPFDPELLVETVGALSQKGRGT
jgi:CheY-like chemotaxis protein